MDPQARAVAWVVAGLVAAPVFFLVGTNAADLLIDLSDPCTEWGIGDRSSVRLDEECPRRSGHSLTRVEAVVSRIAFDGTLAFGAVAGLVAVGRQKPVYAALGSAAFLFAAVPLILGTFGLLAVLFALLLLFLARWIEQRAVPGAEERPAARAALLILVSLAVLVVGVVWRLSPNPVLFGGQAVAAGLGALAVYRHWPRERRAEPAP